jgi:type I restriction enzyme S subunit
MVKALQRARMDHLCELVTDGTHDSPKLQKEGVPFIKGKHISGGTVDFSTCDYITREEHEKACKRVKPQRGDILFSNIGSVGDTAVVNDDRKFSIKNVALFRPDRQKVDQTYFYYLVLTPEFRSNVLNMCSGVAQQFITLGNLRAFEVSYHEDIDEQRRIAGILSTYDELIENSQRRIRILKAMAHALYCEWFVHFRFPGHENHPRIPSPLREIPEGWEVKSLADLMDIKGGMQPPKSQFVYEPQEGFVRLIQIRDYESDSYLTFVKESPKLRLCERTEILIARYGASVARICSGLTGAYNVALAKVIPRNLKTQEFLRQFLSDDEFQKLLIGMSGRAAQNGFNKSDIAAIQLTVPADGRLL